MAHPDFYGMGRLTCSLRFRTARDLGGRPGKRSATPQSMSECLRAPPIGAARLKRAAAGGGGRRRQPDDQLGKAAMAGSDGGHRDLPVPGHQTHVARVASHDGDLVGWC